MPFIWFAKRGSAEKETVKRVSSAIREPARTPGAYPESELLVEHLSGGLRSRAEVFAPIASGARLALLCKLFGVKLVPGDTNTVDATITSLRSVGVKAVTPEDTARKLYELQRWDSKALLYYDTGEYRPLAIRSASLGLSFRSDEERVAYSNFISDLSNGLNEAGVSGFVESLPLLDRISRDDAAFLLSTLHSFSRAVDLSREPGEPGVYAYSERAGLTSVEVGGRSHPIFDGFVRQAVEDPELRKFEEEVRAEIRRIAGERGVNEVLALAIWSAVRDRLGNIVPAWMHYYGMHRRRTAEEITQEEIASMVGAPELLSGVKRVEEPRLTKAVARAVVDATEIFVKIRDVVVHEPTKLAGVANQETLKQEVERCKAGATEIASEIAKQLDEAVSALSQHGRENLPAEYAWVLNLPDSTLNTVRNLLNNWEKMGREELEKEVKDVATKLSDAGCKHLASRLRDWYREVAKVKEVEEILGKHSITEKTLASFAASRLPFIVARIGEYMGTGFKIEKVLESLAPSPEIGQRVTAIVKKYGLVVHPELFVKMRSPSDTSSLEEEVIAAKYTALRILSSDESLAWHTAYALFFAMGIPVTVVHHRNFRVQTVMSVKQMIGDMSVLETEAYLEIPYTDIKREVSVAREFFGAFDQVVKMYLDVAKRSGVLSTGSRGLYQGLLYVFTDTELSGRGTHRGSVLDDLRGAVESIFANLVYASFRVREVRGEVEEFAEKVRKKGFQKIPDEIVDVVKDIDTATITVADIKKRIVELARFPSPRYVEAVSRRSEVVLRAAVEAIESGWDGSEELTKKLPSVASVIERLGEYGDAFNPPKLETPIPNLPDHPVFALDRVVYFLHIVDTIRRALEEEERRRKEEEKKKKEEEEKQKTQPKKEEPPKGREEERRQPQPAQGTQQGETAPGTGQGGGTKPEEEKQVQQDKESGNQ